MCIYSSVSTLQKVYDHPEIQHRLMEANPLLAALPGFHKATGRRLNDAQVRTYTYTHGTHTKHTHEAQIHRPFTRHGFSCGLLSLLGLCTQTTEAFKEGVEGLLKIAKDMPTTVKVPSHA
jgi:hypothetical protein